MYYTIKEYGIFIVQNEKRINIPLTVNKIMYRSCALDYVFNDCVEIACKYY